MQTNLHMTSSWTSMDANMDMHPYRCACQSVFTWPRPAHVFPFSLLQAATVVEPRDLTSASPAGQLDAPGTPQADGDLSAQLALAALEADLSSPAAPRSIGVHNQKGGQEFKK